VPSHAELQCIRELIRRCFKAGNERCRVFYHNKYRQQRAFADADEESQTLG
jgi:hypothetical protein